jgi:hypothetical protein
VPHPIYTPGWHCFYQRQMSTVWYGNSVTKCSMVNEMSFDFRSLLNIIYSLVFHLLFILVYNTIVSLIIQQKRLQSI